MRPGGPFSPPTGSAGGDGRSALDTASWRERLGRRKHRVHRSSPNPAQPKQKLGGKFGGNHGDRLRISAACSELAPEQLCSNASQGGWRRTLTDAILKASA